MTTGQAARCWAKAYDRTRAAECVARLIAQDQLWFLEHMEKCDEFASFSRDEGWNTMIALAKRKAT